MAEFPEPLEADPDEVVTALEVGASMWSRGEQAEAIKWLRKAVDEAFEAGLDERGLELSKSAAAIASLVPPAPSVKPAATSTFAPPATVTAQPSPEAGTVPPPVVHVPAPVPSAPAPTTAPQVIPSPPPPVVHAPPPVASEPPSPVARPETLPAKANEELPPPPIARSEAPASKSRDEPPPAVQSEASPPVRAASEAPPKRASLPLPPTPRTLPPRPVTGRNRSSRPHAVARGASTRPPARPERNEVVAPAVPPRAPPEVPVEDAVHASVAEAVKLAVDDPSTRVTVPSGAPSKEEEAAAETPSKVEEEARDEVVARPRFERKFLTPLAMPRTATPPKPIAVSPTKAASSAPTSEVLPPRSEEATSEDRKLEGVVVEVTPSVLPVSEPPEGATRPALTEDVIAAHERAHSLRAQWTTTGAVRVAVAREGGRVTVRVFDGGPLREGELEAILVATPEVERLFRMLEVDGLRDA